jgi:hypothetical protein
VWVKPTGTLKIICPFTMGNNRGIPDLQLRISCFLKKINLVLSIKNPKHIASQKP